MFDVVIVGGGTSGLMCALNLDKNLKVLILEKTDSLGKKLLITGNGRCNLTNNKTNEDFLNKLTHNKKYLYSTIYNFGPSDIINLFESEVKLKEEENNKIFPVSNKAIDILNFLINKINFKINYNEYLKDISVVDNIITLTTNKQTITTKKLVIATGGASFPTTGSSGDHLVFAKKLNINTIDLYPCETSIILKQVPDIAGTSFDNVLIKSGNYKSKGTLMFTHSGLSGSSIMHLSEYIYLNNFKKLTIDFLPELTIENLTSEIEKNRDIKISTFFNNYFTKKFTLYILDLLNISSTSLIKQNNSKAINNLIITIKNFEYEIKEVSKIEKSYVTGGGISLKEINTKTFASKKYPNIYFIGECLDIHGPIGGYNITLAFSTAYSAASDINSKT